MTTRLHGRYRTTLLFQQLQLQWSLIKQAVDPRSVRSRLINPKDNLRGSPLMAFDAFMKVNLTPVGPGVTSLELS